jgi:ribosomal protein L7/L12
MNLSGGSERRWPRPLHISRRSQQEADRRAGQSLLSLLDPAEIEEIKILLERGELIHAVRRVRELTSLRLIDARRLVETLRH